jgi:hypothetical protein
MPHLPDDAKLRLKGRGDVSGVYKACILPDGHTRVEPIVPLPVGDDAVLATLRTWTFAVDNPLRVPVCTFHRFVFNVR